MRDVRMVRGVADRDNREMDGERKERKDTGWICGGRKENSRRWRDGSKEGVLEDKKERDRWTGVTGEWIDKKLLIRGKGWVCGKRKELIGGGGMEARRGWINR